jgi:hypothetical protein
MGTKTVEISVETEDFIFNSSHESDIICSVTKKLTELSKENKKVVVGIVALSFESK